MSKFLRVVLVCVMSLMTSMTLAQQLPDSGFEDWGGTQFDGKEQPKYWNFSNVEQLGVKRNFAHKTTGRSGSALKIQDQFVGVGSIGATSPGYVALGYPWAYVSSLTSIEDATAGTYGGITWKYRPDSMVVWIKRYYDSGADNAAGDHTKDENFNLIYYAWSGTSKGTSYKAKNLTCTDLSSAAPQYCVDEESDIRLALNGNECGTPKQQAKQIAEGWYYEKKAYKDWTRIVVPIYYFNDDVPDKCNVILSAGNYPNFRANSGQNAGNSMDVDDIQLVYSSKIQKLYINDKEWKGFNPNSTEPQTYSLGLGATTMPDNIVAVRGAGSLTNNRGGKATFPGRRLGDKECVIKRGTVDGEPTTITVTSEDGKSTTVYTIKFVSQSSDNARLSDIKVNGTSVNGFNAYLTSYSVSLPYGTTEAPQVEVTTQDASATVSITQAASPTGQATIVVTAGNGTTKQTYTVSFSVAALTDVTLKALYLDNNLVPGFVSSKSNYVVSLPLGTTAAPKITWESAYAEGVQTIKLLNNTLEQGAQIQVSIAGTTYSKTYKITYKIEASSYSYLAGIALDGTALEGFAAEKTVYAITLPMGATALPKITWTQGDAYQTVKMTEGGVDGVTTIEVKAASGAVTTYRLTFQTEKSSNTALAGIALDGVALANFDPDTLEYTVTLPAGVSTLPKITWTTGDAYQTVSLFSNQTQLTARLTVTAGDGSTRVYRMTFELDLANTLLEMIYLDGKELEGFDPERMDYSLVWQSTTMPKVTVSTYEGQAVAISTPATYGLIRIVVTPEEGAPNTYSVRLNSPDDVQLPPFPADQFKLSDNAQLAELYIDGKKYEAFKAGTYNYMYTLPAHTRQAPAVMAVAGTPGQTITIEHGAVNRPTLIKVLAADKKTEQTYTIRFITTSSSNTLLSAVEIDGVNFEFDPAKKTYKDLMLPYGTTQTPAIMAERAEKEQSLTITTAPIGTPSTVVVTAENGSKATYSFSFRLAYPELPNELQAIIIDGVGALDMSQGPDFTVELPYGTKTLDILSLSKTYPEQEVVILNGGVTGPTTLTVKALNPADADRVYTITPHMPAYDPAMLTEIKINGVPLEQFQPDRYNYVISVPDETPTLDYTKQDGAEVDEDSNAKWVKLTVEAGDEGEYQHTYLVTYYYPNDFSFDQGFENWKDTTNAGAGNQSGTFPKGWNASITAVTSGDAGTYYPGENTAASSTHTEGSKSAQLATTYLLTSAESMPGFLSLAQPTVSVGKWILGYEMHSSLAFGDPVSFRNTPDRVQIDYNFQEYQNNATGWKFVYNANGMKQVNHSGAFSKLTANKWYTLDSTLTYAPDFIPMTLDILICAAPSIVLEDYYTNFGTNRSTSKMLVDNLRFSFNSQLKGLSVNGSAATLMGTAAMANIDPDSYGMPQLAFTHTVADQMPIVTWGDEVNGERKATIRNYAEDLSYTDYTLTVKRNKSTNTTCSYTLEGRDLTVVKGSPYQTLSVTKNDTAYVIVVTAESGAKKTYYAAWTASTGASGTSQVTTILADGFSGESTAKLQDLVEQPIINYTREYALDSVVMTTTDTCHYIHVFGANADTTYIIERHPSDNALLASIKTNDKEVPGFYEETYDYVISLSSLDEFEAKAQDPEADVQYVVVPIDNANSAVFVQVTAADAKTVKRYSLLVRLHDLSKDAYLVSVSADGNPLAGFQSTQYDYTIELPAGSAIPELSSVVCAGATVEMTTTRIGSSADVAFVVTAEDGVTQQTYTVHVHVQPSDVCTLSNLFVGDGAVPSFANSKYEYSVELPYGTTELPFIDYVVTDKHSKAAMDVQDMKVTITVTAEDGVHTNTYVIIFTIAKSNNADLKLIALDGAELANFFAEELHYTVQLPYGTELPAITAEAVDAAAQVVIEGNTITVTAEDGVTTRTYTIDFTFLPSENALLLALKLDTVLQAGFAPEVFEYQDTVYFGMDMPVITWTPGDEQQVVDTTWNGDTQLTITVTAGDGVTISEYVITFVHVLSPNCYLADLQVNGVTVSGFHRDSLEYTIVYPIGTDSAALCGVKEIIAIPEDKNAIVSIKEENNVIQIFVTAPDGSIKVYTIVQKILLSSEARLKMIWLDGKEVRGFMSDTLEYTITLAQGAILPMIDAEPLDTLARWEMGMETEIENGKQVELYGEAQDGQTVTYRLLFVYANWAPESVVNADDYLFFYAGDGVYKAVTIGIGVQLAIYDMNGQLVMMQTMPVAEPDEVVVGNDQNDEQFLLRANSDAQGLTFRPIPGKVYFYVFFDSKTKKIAKGAKFGLQ